MVASLVYSPSLKVGIYGLLMPLSAMFQLPKKMYIVAVLLRSQLSDAMS
jgi:hypothetical protein